ncbi:MAG: hypothetical protein KDK08_05315 [Rhizobiaceae bacterium]|nr:hypothetical protein [Rhizobiaceae bacterium]MCC0000889.1 hypothetical protein [Methylobacteriaceae bacterium]
MSKQLSLDEMLEVLIDIESPRASFFRSMLESVGGAMADEIATTLDVRHGLCSFQGVAFAGTCTPFGPSKAGQPCPPALTPYDEGEWDTDVVTWSRRRPPLDRLRTDRSGAS